MHVELARLACYCIAVMAMIASSKVIAYETRQYVSLPGSPLSAKPMVGWHCHIDAIGITGNETERLVCMPPERGAGIALNKWLTSDRPISLRDYFESHKASYESDAKSFYSEPAYITNANKPAVEVIETTNGILTVMSDPPKMSPIKSVIGSIVFEDRDVFYQCWFETEAKYYTVELRNRLHTFCDSIKFDAN